ncbi:UBA/TS-N domain-containing protein [Metschnikowia aff. pulcherrima]|uniref:UBA/TS-N domain-containing protein n=1 Tax=Metschnikowia aff. pulcherrima TaxID=2163413 RepID=A0A4P6XR65_9ASCO|nr:UBA/TS-N domain-containing protein [Metschnikowia aff. pulcherrima]
MVNDSQIEMLQEMGFLRQQASEALTVSGNDLNKAIAFLFGEDDGSSGAGTQQLPYDVEQGVNHILDSVNIQNPHDIPNFVGLYASTTPLEEVRHYERPISDDSVAPSSDSLVNMHESMKENMVDYPSVNLAPSSSSDSLEDAILNSLLNEEEYPENIKTDLTNVPMILSKTRDVRCWVPLLMILAHSSAFAVPILELKSELPFVQEVQKIVYFMHKFNESKRWYVDTDQLATFLGKQGPRGSYHEEEMVLGMIDYLMSQEPALRPIFESMVQSLDEEIDKDLTVLEIDADSRGTTLYDTLNELFWQKDFEFLGKIKYSSVAPIVTYQLVADSDTVCVPFLLQETIYPEIYSDKAEARVRDEIHSIKRAQMDYHTLNRKLMDFNFFEGKKIDGILSQTAAALHQTNPGASDDILGLAEQLKTCRLSEIQNQDRAKINASPERLTLFENIIADLPNLRPYKLIGVIFSESRYFVRASDTWIDMDAGVTVDFANVRSTVENCAGPHLITLIYEEFQTNDAFTIIAHDEDETTANDNKIRADHVGKDVFGESSSNVNRAQSEENGVCIEQGKESVDGVISQIVTSAAADMSKTAHNSPDDTDTKMSLANPGSSAEEESKSDLVLSAQDIVKRPKWAMVDGRHKDQYIDNPAPKTQVKVVRVRQNVVQRFVEDETNLPNAAV